MKDYKIVLVYIVGICLLLMSWEYLGEAYDSVRLFISTPSSVFRFVIQEYESLLYSLFVTTLEAVIGLLIASVLSFVLAVICVRWNRLIDYISPILIFSQVIPLIVLAPFFIILLGIGVQSKIAMAAITSFFPIFINFIAGYNQIPKSIIEMAILYNMNFRDKFRHIYLPLSARNIFAGMKISSTMAVIAAIVGEFSGASSGIGHNLLICTYRLEPDLLMANLLLSITLGCLLYLGVVFVERRCMGDWYLKSMKVIN